MKSLPAQSAASPGSAESIFSTFRTPMTTFSIQKTRSSGKTSQPQKRTRQHENPRLSKLEKLAAYFRRSAVGREARAAARRGRCRSQADERNDVRRDQHPDRN